ncbi:DUF3783 domain-containing protein [Clostridium algidicarnis]|uniref:DUF3783 domain-containing protein n=1 Tax=Clostridium algidicarnis TaxID=37659 RepID=A0ABS6C0N1_9CLOT|nr:DUF3783 domain-containing protein [Clostridium algidicarnis]MBB6630054.1 DUF3783 domain-containing protein [Clostridium algidicarnis]MBB6696942.1 DUF3783 domain-containing protein [Clostridium algidicarnis]MBU3193291.1 DUF3783 domain-containing protein [Clostridium algidicarnis]MBU3204647.1 DUF3783 domain-containing protein [Clostridium algidicarnis]MBU3206601.1 DUF3783 domain-containing protein [Clostridium algidicarnis]
MANKMILAYGLEQKDLEVFKMSNIEYKVITTKIFHDNIEDIIERSAKEEGDESLPKEKVILFNGFSDDELDKIIKLVRATIGRSPILAVVTDTSKKWTFGYLVEHLIEEREWYKKMQEEKGSN